MAIGAGRKLGFEGLFGLPVIEPGDARLPCLQPDQHLRQLAVGGRSGDQRHIGSALEDPLPFLLRHAAQHDEALARRIKLLVVVQAIEDFLFGFVADGAGVVEDQIGGSFGIHLGVAFMAKRADDFFRVMHVHLATESLEIERFIGRHVKSEYTAASAGHDLRGRRCVVDTRAEFTALNNC